MSETRTYRLIRGSYGRMEDGRNTKYQAGSHTFIEMTEEEAAKLRDVDGSMVELVDKDAFDKLSKETVVDDIDVRTLSVPNAQDFVKTLTDLDVLKVVEAMEGDGKGRKGVLAAIAAQRETLEAAED